MTAASLPDEILLKIFSKLDGRSNAANSCVCKSWTEAATDMTWEHLGDWTQPLASMVGTRKLDDGTVVRVSY